MNAYREIWNYSSTKSEKVEFIFGDLTETPLLGLIVKSFYTFHYTPWIFSLIGSSLVGLSGIFPLLVIPVEDGENLKVGGEYIYINIG